MSKAIKFGLDAPIKLSFFPRADRYMSCHIRHKKQHSSAFKKRLLRLPWMDQVMMDTVSIKNPNKPLVNQSRNLVTNIDANIGGACP